VYHTEEEREAAIDRKATIAAEGGWKYEAVGVLVVDGSVGRCYNCGRVSTKSSCLAVADILADRSLGRCKFFERARGCSNNHTGLPRASME
jgi:hypothetical protein